MSSCSGEIRFLRARAADLMSQSRTLSTAVPEGEKVSATLLGGKCLREKSKPAFQFSKSVYTYFPNWGEARSKTSVEGSCPRSISLWIDSSASAGALSFLIQLLGIDSRFS